MHSTECQVWVGLETVKACKLRLERLLRRALRVSDALMQAEDASSRGETKADASAGSRTSPSGLPQVESASEETQRFPPQAAHHAPQAQVHHAHQGAVAEHLAQGQVPCTGMGVGGWVGGWWWNQVPPAGRRSSTPPQGQVACGQAGAARREQPVASLCASHRCFAVSNQQASHSRLHQPDQPACQAGQRTRPAPPPPSSQPTACPP